MKIETRGHCSEPSVAIIGAWDPYLEAHADLFGRMQDHARKSGWSTLAILLDPNPAVYVRGPELWPVYNDLPWRIRYILGSGIDGVAVISCDEGILGRGIRDLLDCVAPDTDIRELWVGAQQTLGRGEGGNLKAINREAQARAMTVHVLECSVDAFAGSHARRFLQAGSVVQAVSLVKRPPTWCRPADGRLCVAWPAGRYRARVVDDASRPVGEETLALDLSPERDGFSAMRWPTNADGGGLQFIAGPADPAD